MKEDEAARLTDGMMNRINWFTYLRIIFDNTSVQCEGNILVPKKDFLAQLLAYQAVKIN